MNENKNMIEDMIRNVEDKTYNIVEQVEEDEIILEPKKKESKQQKAIRLVEQAKNIVKETDHLSSQCKLQLMNDLEEYEDAKISLTEGGFNTCSVLLEKIDYISMEDDTLVDEIVVVDNDSVKPIIIKEVSSGKFTGILSALIVGSVTAVVLFYLATEKLGMTWFDNIEPNVYIGAGVLGVCVLLVMVIVYNLRVSLIANSNLHFAVKQFVEAELYAENKSDCKVEMDKVGAHIKDAIDTFKTYEILFNEQQGKLQRILHIEGEKENVIEYHVKSFAEISETKELIRTIRDFMAQPMIEKGKLSKETGLHLEKVKTQMDYMIERLY